MAVAHRYELLRPLGAGSATRVHLAHDRLADRTVALKIAPADAPETIHRELVREFRLLRELAVPGLPRVFDAGRDAQSGDSYLALEHVDGPDLDKILRDTARPTFADLQPTLRGIAGALAVLHGAGIAHGDLKPANVLLPMTADGPALTRPVLIDFGLARDV